MPLTHIPLSELTKVGKGLDRPEDVVVGRDGRVWASDQTGRVAYIKPDGSLKRIGKPGGAPNGNNMDRQGRILIAHFAIGTDAPGMLERIDPNTGKSEILCDTLEGRKLIASNYPIVCDDGAIYCTHSTWAQTMDKAMSPDHADGFVYRVDPKGGARIVAEGLRFANGCCLDPGDKHLYVAETSGACIQRYEVQRDGSLGQAKQYGPKLGVIPSQIPHLGKVSRRERGRLGYTDGCGFDEEGNLWVTLVFANKVIAITPNFQVVVMIDDPDGAVMRTPTNVTWGGPDMRDLYIGQLSCDYVIKTRSPVPGMKLIHQR